MKLSIFLAIIISLSAVPAQAGATIGLGYATGVSPYKGYDTKQAVLPWVSYENDYFYLRGLSLGLKLYDRDSLELSAFLAYDPQRFKSSDSSDRQLKRLKNRSDGFLAGGRAMFNHQVGIFSASLAGDISDHSRGFAGQFSYAKPFDLDPFTLTPVVGLYWASDQYNDYYYGVSRQEAAASGLPAYQAEASVSPFGALKADLALGEEKRFGIFAQAEVIFLASTIKDSPMVDRSTSVGFSTGFRYSFR